MNTLRPNAPASRQLSTSSQLMVITPVYPPARGGIETLTEGIVTNWPGRTEVVTLREPGSPEFDASQTYRICRARNQPRGGRRALAQLTALAAVRAMSFRPDIVLSMHIRCGRAAQLVRSLTGARWVQYYHAKEIPTWPSSTRLCADQADHHIAVSRFTASLLTTEHSLAHALSIIPPAISPRPIAAQPRAVRPTVLTIARVNDAYKGHDTMLAAVARVRDAVPDVQWVVVGDGTRLARLKADTRARGLDGTVDFRGSVDDATRDALLASSHVFAMPSRTIPGNRGAEGFGIVYLEAAAAGLPVVAGNQGGAVDAVSPDVSGVLLDPSDDTALAASIISLLTDQDRYTAMSHAAIEWSRRFSWETLTPTIHAALTGHANPVGRRSMAARSAE